MQYPGTVDPKQFEMGVKDVKPGATFGKPLGGYDSSPETFIKSHSKEPVLPSRELVCVQLRLWHLCAICNVMSDVTYVGDVAMCDQLARCVLC